MLRRPSIASVFAHPGIPGYIFLEGIPLDVAAALDSLVTVFKTRPCLVPPEHQTALLVPCNPLSRRIHISEWVRS